MTIDGVAYNCDIQAKTTTNEIPNIKLGIL